MLHTIMNTATTVLRRSTLALLLLLLFGSAAEAQIYMCTADDGTRVFSDERCGPDAKVVPGISTKKASAPQSRSKPDRTPRTPEELEALLADCNAGSVRACNEWTHGGGPNYLREQEQKAGAACERGSLPDCEKRYCLDGMTDECRTRVFAAAKVSGDSWYLREQRAAEDGATAYEVRCAKEGVRTIRDATITCSGPPGPNRCVPAGGERGFARLDQAAVSYCAKE